MTMRLTATQLDQLLATFHPLRCWRFNRYLGSMLTLDLGERIEVPTAASTNVTVGSLAIGIRNVLWQALDGERIVGDAESVDAVLFANELAQRPIGAALERLETTADARWLVFRFDNGFALQIDATNSWQTDSDLFEITLPDGRFVVLDEDCAIEVLDEMEPVRAARWRARLS